MSGWSHASEALATLAEPRPVPVVPGHGLSAARRHEIAIEDAWLATERRRAAREPHSVDSIAMPYALFAFSLPALALVALLVVWIAS